MSDFGAIKAAALLNAIELVGDYGGKTNNNVLLYGGYNTMAYVLHESMRTQPLGLVNAYWNAFSNLTVTMLGVYMGETYTTMQYAGIATIAAGIWMLAKD